MAQHCPYCVEGLDFKLMDLYGDYFICQNCCHTVGADDTLCLCSNCISAHALQDAAPRR
jgi:hypothetical protein